jgi:hypothetical protein
VKIIVDKIIREDNLKIIKVIKREHMINLEILEDQDLDLMRENQEVEVEIKREDLIMITITKIDKEEIEVAIILINRGIILDQTSEEKKGLIIEEVTSNLSIIKEIIIQILLPKTSVKIVDHHSTEIKGMIKIDLIEDHQISKEILIETLLEEAIEVDSEAEVIAVVLEEEVSAVEEEAEADLETKKNKFLKNIALMKLKPSRLQNNL